MVCYCTRGDERIRRIKKGIKDKFTIMIVMAKKYLRGLFSRSAIDSFDGFFQVQLKDIYVMCTRSDKR